MTPVESAIAEYKKTILDLSDRLSNMAGAYATLLAENEKLKKDTQNEPQQ